MNGPATPIPAAPMPKPLAGPSPLRHQLHLNPPHPGDPAAGGYLAVPAMGHPPSLAPSRIDSGAHHHQHSHHHHPAQTQAQPGRPPLAAFGAGVTMDPNTTPLPQPEGITADVDAEGEPDDHDIASISDYPHSAYNYGTWTAADDRTLLTARASGQHWADLQRTHFPTKTANACRKRYERLVERRGVYDYDARRLERISKEYMTMRKEIWSGLAARVGEKWSVVEAQCMSAGLRTIQSNARSHTNRWRRETKMSQKASRVPPETSPSATGPVTTMGLISPVEDEFGAGLIPGLEEHGQHGLPAPLPPSRSAAETMPPPYLPAGGVPILAPPQRPQVSFAGYLNGKSTRQNTAKGTVAPTAYPEPQQMAPPPIPPPPMDLGWQHHGHGGYPGHSGQVWRDDGGMHRTTGKYPPR